ncbi:MAG: hypothetical protein VW270_02100 [Candidatus Poseidoniales archaeon]|jgi:hypothetical protein
MIENQFVKRLKSFGWRFAMVAVAAAFAWAAENVGLLELTPMQTTFLGLVLGEISKYLNTGRS